MVIKWRYPPAIFFPGIQSTKGLIHQLHNYLQAYEAIGKIKLEQILPYCY